MTDDLARLKWLCRRGTKELDTILNRYLEQHYPTASKQEQQQFTQLLELEDPILYDMLLNPETHAEPQYRDLIAKLLIHS